MNNILFRTVAGLLLTMGITSIFMVPGIQQQVLAQVRQPQNMTMGINPMTGTTAMGNMASPSQMQMMSNMMNMMSGMMNMMSGMMNMMSGMQSPAMSNNTGMNMMSSMHTQGSNMTTMR